MDKIVLECAGNGFVEVLFKRRRSAELPWQRGAVACSELDGCTVA